MPDFDHHDQWPQVKKTISNLLGDRFFQDAAYVFWTSRAHRTAGAQQKNEQKDRYASWRILIQDQIIKIVHIERDNTSELSESETRDRHKQEIEVFEKYFPNLIKKKYILNTPTILRLFFESVSIFKSRKQKEKIAMLSTDYKETLDKEIGLGKLPECIGGTNKTPLNDYNNLFDKYLEKSWKGQRVGFSKEG